MQDLSTGPADDKGLRLGLLAFQRDFVTLNDLIAALRVWSGEPSRSLEQVLIDRGVLSPEAQTRLAAMGTIDYAPAEEQKAATVSEARAAFGQLPPTTAHDPAAAAREHGLGGTDRTSVLPTVAGTGAGRGDPSRYRVVRPYAQGGLGEVFLAEDVEVRRPVALKKIKRQYVNDAPSLSRFLREAEITGGLEHPGVVPVYGLGTAPDGVPYYAMRLIKGETLQEAIRRFHASGPREHGQEAAPLQDAAERRLALRSLLRRFVDVCNAVAYAHSRGVLHRDLKPANIMLSDYGQTLVIDWGLARVRGAGTPSGDPDRRGADGEEALQVVVDEAVLTRMGSAMGTPAFMSPEQAAGRLDELGPASDVYSLGATLFTLLTGRAAVGGRDVRAILARAERGDVPSPRQVRPDVPAALDAVCRKAMAFRPADRYPSALELAGEIEHWLADEPVSAYAEPVGARLARWSRRHRPLVTGVAAAVTVGLVALALSTAWLAAANRRLEAANAAETAAKKEAQEQEARAQENFRLARESVNRYLKRVSEDRRLKDAGLARLRKGLLDEAGGFYLTFIRERADDPTLEKELSQAYLQAARIEIETGDKARALQRCQEARAYLQRLTGAHPDDLTYQTELAGCTVQLGLMSRAVGRTEDAGAYYREALQRLEPLAATHPEDAEVLKYLAGAYKSLGTLQRARADYLAAVEAMGQARAVFERLTAAHPDVGDYADSLAGTWNNLGLIRRDQGNHQEAVTALRAALAVQEQLVDRFPEQDEYRNFLAAIHANLGLAYESGDRLEEAEKEFQAAVPLYRRVADRHPEVAYYRQSQAMGLNELGRFYGDINKPEQALKTLNEALEIWRQLVARNPEVNLSVSELGRCLANVGNLHYGQGRYAEALPLHQEAMALREKLAAGNPDVTLFTVDLQNSQDDVGLVLKALGRYAEAEAAFQAAVSTSGKLVAKYPNVPSHLSHFGHSQHHLGTLYLDTGYLAKAEEAYRAALKTREKLVAMAGNTPYYRHGLADTQAALGNLLGRVGRHTEVETFLQAGLTILEDLVAKDPDMVDYVSSLGDLYDAWGDHEERQGRHEPAVKWYGRAVESLTALRAKNPAAERARRYLINGHSGRATALSRLNRLAEAQRDWDAALKLALDEEKPGLRLGRATTVARGGDHARAAGVAEEQTRDPKTSAGVLMEAAGVFALAGPAALRDTGLAPAERTPTAERYAARALELLRRARDLKFFEERGGRTELDTSADLEWLRTRDDFKKFRAGLKAE